MLKKLSVVLVCLAAFVLWGNEFPFEKLSPGIKVISFHPKTIDGVYFLNENKTPSFRLRLKNTSRQKVKFNSVIEITDYFDQPVQKQAGQTVEIQPDKIVTLDFELPNWRKTGHFTVTARFSDGGKNLGWSQAAFIVLTEQQKKRDPFFMIDKNGSLEVMAEAMKKIGCGSRFIWVNGTAPLLKATPEERKRLYDKLHPGRRTKEMESDFMIVGSAAPDVKFLPSVRERLKNGLAPVSDADLQLIREHYEKTARLLRDKINMWIIQEEFDAIQDIPACKKDFLHYLSTYALVAKNTYLGLKAGNPDCTVAVLGICGNDYFLSKSKFLYSKMILDALHGSFDLICIDAYSGNWNGTRSGFTPPERFFRKLLLDTIELSASYGKPKKVVNSERCFAVLYTSAFDSARNRQQADMTARSLIINKSVDSPFYSIHLGSMFWISTKFAQRPTVRYADQGVWKPTFDENRKNFFIPRRMAVSIATTAKELAFTDFISEKIINKQVYLYSFKKQNSPNSVIAAWTIGKPSELTITLPEKVCVTDITGQKKQYQKGKLKVELGSSPVFIEFKADKAGVQNVLRTTGIQPVVPVLAEARRTGANIALFALKNVSKKTLQVKHPFGQSVLKANEFQQRTIKLTSSNNDTFTIVSGGKKSQCKLDGPLMKMPHITGTFAEYLRKSAKDKPLLLTAPNDIYPKLVLMPEYGYFINGFDKPSATVRLAWDAKNLYVYAKVTDEKHMPAENLRTLHKGDCFRFLVNIGNRGFSREMGAAGSANVFRFTLADVKDCQVYSINTKNAPVPEKEIKVSIKRTGNTTSYECAIPWSHLTGKTKFTPANGRILGFAAAIVNQDSEKKPSYSLATSPSGISDQGETIPFMLTK